MNSSDELYNRLSEKLGDLVPVKNGKQVSNWIWVVAYPDAPQVSSRPAEAAPDGHGDVPKPAATCSTADHE